MHPYYIFMKAEFQLQQQIRYEHTYLWTRTAETDYYYYYLQWNKEKSVDIVSALHSFFLHGLFCRISAKIKDWYVGGFVGDFKRNLWNEIHATFPRES